jgi:hypothetical protein
MFWSACWILFICLVRNELSMSVHLYKLVLNYRPYACASLDWCGLCLKKNYWCEFPYCGRHGLYQLIVFLVTNMCMCVHDNMSRCGYVTAPYVHAHSPPNKLEAVTYVTGICIYIFQYRSCQTKHDILRKIIKSWPNI